MSDEISVLDPEHWLYDDIVFAMWPADGASGVHYDVANEKVYNSVGTISGASRAVDENGEYLGFSPAGSAQSAAHEIALGQPPELALTSKLTVLIGYKRTGDQDSGYGRIICRTNGASGDDWGLAQETVAGGSNLRWRIGTDNIFTTTVMGLNEYHDIAVTGDTTAPDQRIYVDGIQEAAQTSTFAFPIDQDISIGASPSSNTRNIYGDIYYVIILDKVLSPTDIARFTEDVDAVRLDTAFDYRTLQAVADTTAPVLSLPTGTTTGSMTASGTVTTDEGNGTLYFLASTNATETASTIKAGSNQSVSGSGSQAVSFTGLTASTTYYPHYVHDDAASNESNVQSGSSFTTNGAGGGIMHRSSGSRPSLAGNGGGLAG